MHHAATSSSVHRSRWKALLGPLLLAEIGFTLLCLGAGALIWQASERRETENELARLQASHSVYARQLDTRLSTQQQHLRMLSRATRRVLVSAATQTRPARILTSDLPAVLSHDDVERVMTTLLDDYYAMDSLVSRLFVMPEGMRAFSVPEPLHETALPPYQRDATPQGTEQRGLVAAGVLAGGVPGRDAKCHRRRPLSRESGAGNLHGPVATAHSR
ncbi:hypothetical protein [Chromohalobacter israelensis]